MEEVEEAIFLDKVPQTWEIKAYPSLLGLCAWFSDLLCRLKELEAWVADFCVSQTSAPSIKLYFYETYRKILLSYRLQFGWVVCSIHRLF